MSGVPYVCGEARHVQGRAPRGWLSLRVAAGRAQPWYCSAPCLVRALGVDPTDEPADPGELTAREGWRAVAELGRLAGTGLTMLNATPDRLDRAREVALRRVAAHVERLHDQSAPLVVEQSEQDRADRPAPAPADVAAGALALALSPRTPV